jgi:anti-sigma regulatory factor (Ser/Thr protein kinase)
MAAETRAERTLGPHPSSAGEARRFAARALVGWGAPDLVDTVTLLVSELVTNAILHARSTVLLAVELRGSTVHVEVSDESAAQPQLLPADEGTVNGRGLGLVDSCADHWGTDRLGNGKCVWFDVAAMPAAG